MSSPACRGRYIPLTTHTLGKPRTRRLHESGHIADYLIVDVAVGKHGVEIVNTFLGVPVVTVLKPFLDCSHVHWAFNYFIIVLKEHGKRVVSVTRNYEQCVTQRQRTPGKGGNKQTSSKHKPNHYTST